jgi:hypothetical protein
MDSEERRHYKFLFRALTGRINQREDKDDESRRRFVARFKWTSLQYPELAAKAYQRAKVDQEIEENDIGTKALEEYRKDRYQGIVIRAKVDQEIEENDIGTKALEAYRKDRYQGIVIR